MATQKYQQHPSNGIPTFTGDALQLVSSFAINTATGMPYWAETARPGSTRSDAGHLVAAVARELADVGKAVEKNWRDPEKSEVGKKRFLEKLGHDALLKLAQWRIQAQKLRLSAANYRAELEKLMRPEGDPMTIELRSREIRETLRTVDQLNRPAALFNAIAAGDKLVLAAVKGDPCVFASVVDAKTVTEAHDRLLSQLAPDGFAEMELIDKAISGAENAVETARRSIINMCRLESNDPIVMRIFPEGSNVAA